MMRHDEPLTGGRVTPEIDLNPPSSERVQAAPDGRPLVPRPDFAHAPLGARSGRGAICRLQGVLSALSEAR